MADIQMAYMSVQMNLGDDGMDFNCWVSTVDLWKGEGKNYPFSYTYLGDWCTWLIHSNTQLTSKVLAVLGEQCDRICKAQESKNETRKLSNR